MKDNPYYKKIPIGYLGHTFTQEERNLLESGEIVNISGLKSPWFDMPYSLYIRFVKHKGLKLCKNPQTQSNNQENPILKDFLKK